MRRSLKRMTQHCLTSCPLRRSAQLAIRVGPRRAAMLNNRRQPRHLAAVSSQNGDGSKLSRGKVKPNWPLYLATMASWGAVTGTLLDGIHSRVQLQIYDFMPLSLGPLHTSAIVPPLLGTFYLAIAALQYFTDQWLQDNETTQAALTRSQDPAFVALGGGVLALLLYLSATLFEAQFPPEQIFAVLASAALVNWRLMDNTVQGAALAVLCAVGAPAIEILVNHYILLWHYPQADLFDGAFVSWVPWCYFFYTPALSNLSRYMWQR